MNTNPSSTSPERWNQVSDILQQLMDVASDEQERVLDQLCGDDEKLKEEVLSFMKAHDKAGRFLKELDDERTHALLRSDLRADQQTEQNIGPYRVIKELGRGGMGVVYLAERSDGQFEQQVALKLIKRGMDSDAIERRFLHERQILARLQHPNIARLLDGNITPQGQPYFAMEYIDGETLTTYCNRNSASIDERLRLFEEVAKAVQYAHANLVVHRDLKPSNMLVDKDGQLKLLDFGIAKVLTGENESAATGLTDAGARAMTPEYAAPEQIAGEPVTTSTDVYSLGVVLYELLTGHRPFRVDARSPQALADVMNKSDPPAPSSAISEITQITHADGRSETITPADISRQRALSFDKLRRRLSGDLDTIALKALSKEPQRRYASAEAFVDDIRRHLKGLPVDARRDTLGYRVNKFVSRHAIGVSLAVLIVLIVAGFGVAMGYQQQQTAAERDKAQLEAVKSERVTEFMMDLFDANYPDDASGDTLNAFELMERGKKKVGALSDEPAVQAEMLEVMGRIYERMGKLDEAQPLVEQSLTIRQALYPAGHEDLASSLNRVGLLRWNQGKYDEAEPFLRQALEMKKTVLVAPHEEIASAMNDLAKLYRYLIRLEEAEPLFRAALAMRKDLLGAAHEDVATTANNLALVLRDTGNLEESEELIRESLNIYRRVYGDEHSAVGIVTGNLTLVLQDRGAYEEAINLRLSSNAMIRRMFGELHPIVAWGLKNLASLYMDAGDYASAQPNIEEAVARLPFSYPENHPQKADILSVYADWLVFNGDFAQAESLYQEAFLMMGRVLDPSHPGVSQGKYALANLYYEQGRYEMAATYLEAEDVIKGLQKAYGASHAQYAKGLLLKGQIYLGQQELALAEEYLQNALAILRATRPDHHIWVVQTRNSLARCLIARHQYPEAEALLHSSLKIIKAQPLVNPVSISQTHAVLAMLPKASEAV